MSPAHVSSIRRGASLEPPRPGGVNLTGTRLRQRIEGAHLRARLTAAPRVHRSAVAQCPLECGVVVLVPSVSHDLESFQGQELSSISRKDLSVPYVVGIVALAERCTVRAARRIRS